MTDSDPGTCAVHGMQMIVEPGGPDATALHGRVYCPGCQDDLNRALDAMDTNDQADATLTFRTRFSTYEVDLPGRRVRRITGERQPTPRQGTDGDWRGYQDILAAPMPDGLSVWFDWTGLGNGMLTSAVAPDDVDQVLAALVDDAGVLRFLGGAPAPRGGC